MKLKDDTCLHIGSCLLNSFYEQLKSLSLPSVIVKIAYDKYKAILTAMYDVYDGDIGHIKTLLNHNNVNLLVSLVDFYVTNLEIVNSTLCHNHLPLVY